MKNIVYFLFLILLSCQNDKIFTEKEIFSEKLLFNQLINPQKIFIKGNTIIVFERTGILEYQPPIHLIDLKSHQYLSPCGKLGFGPGEISDAHNFDHGFDNTTFWVYSAIDKKISEFNLTDCMEISLNQIKQSEHFFKVYNALFSEENKFIGMQVDSPYRFLEFDIISNEEKGYGSLKNFTDKNIEDPFILSQLNMGWFGSSADKNIFAVAYNFFPVIEIFNKKSDEFHFFESNESFKAKFQIIGNNNNEYVYWDLNSPYQFRDIFITANHVYALYGGFSENQIKSHSLVANKIYKLNLKGELIDIYQLDRSINNFAVNESENVIVGITTDENPGLAFFKLIE